MGFAFASNTPESVRRRVQWWLAIEGLDPRQYAAIKRLATYPAMTSLWGEKIPADRPGMEVSVLDRAIVACGYALALQPPIPRTRVEFTEYLQKHRIVPFSFFDIAVLTKHLREKLTEIPSDWRSRWPHVAPTGSTFESALTALEDIAVACERLDTEARDLEAGLELPKPPRRLGAKNAQRTYFGLIMSDFLARVYGRPCDPIVTIFEDVVFDLKGEIEDATARSRRRR
jgi:hypothetical protein